MNIFESFLDLLLGSVSTVLDLAVQPVVEFGESLLPEEGDEEERAPLSAGETHVISCHVTGEIDTWKIFPNNTYTTIYK